ncbi:MAG: hypothetical protein ACTSU2_02160 [Promethearchaeota archaeon]
MAEEDEKLKDLDEKILQADQLKSLILGEITKLNESLSAKVKGMGVDDPQAITAALNSLKTFLQSSTNMMSSLSNQIKSLTSEIMKVKTMLDQVGRLMSS